MKVLNYLPTSYPYTIAINYTYDSEDTSFIPKFYFQAGYRLAVEKSEIIIANNSGIPLQLVENNYEGYTIENKSVGDRIHYVATELPAIEKEPHMPPAETIFPSVNFSLEKFSLKGHTGNAVSWNDLGKWVYKDLLSSQRVLPQAAIMEVQSLTKGMTDTLAMVREVYNYVLEQYPL